MKVGDYVRFKDKRGNTYIRKVIDGYKAHWYGCKVDKEANNVPYVSAKNIIKSSPNIIDLIEVKDIIKFQCISDEYDFEYKEQYINQINNNDDLESFKEAVENEDLKLISIVTHEMFESMEYKVGD